MFLFVCLVGCCLSACITASIREIEEFEHQLKTFETLTKNRQDIFLRTPKPKEKCLCARICLQRTVEDLQDLQKEFDSTPESTHLGMMAATLERVIKRVKNDQKTTLTPDKCISREYGLATAIQFFHRFFGTLRLEDCIKESEEKAESNKN